MSFSGSSLDERRAEKDVAGSILAPSSICLAASYKRTKEE
jgi:hypothetical protein